MKVNWRKFWIVLGLLEVVVLLMGCSASWLGAVSALLPALEAAVNAAIAFVVALEGKTVPASLTAAVEKIGSDIASQIANVQALLADFKNAAVATQNSLLGQIEALFQGILTNLQSILAGFNITDTATVSKLTQLVGLAVAAAQAIIAFIPLVQTKLAQLAAQPGITREQQDEALRAEDKFATKQINSIHNGLKEGYVDIVTGVTTSTDVNTALAALPQQLP
jgi:hypothetical protein